MIRIAILVSGGGTNLQALIDAQNRDENRHGELSLVISSNSQAYALTRAKLASIDTCVLEKSSFNSNQEYEIKLLEILKDYQIDLIVLAGFMTILGKNVIDAFRGRIINVHPSLIPSFCGEGCYGIKVHEAALDRGVKISGATVHFVNEVCDGGEIIAQKSTPVIDGDTPQSLQKRVMEECEWVILPKSVASLCEQLYKQI